MVTTLKGIVSTIDFHVTSDCNQKCPYCWGPQDYNKPVDTDIALRIVSRVKGIGARRIVFTGGDPLKRNDLAKLIRHAKQVGLEVALSTSGDELTKGFLNEVAPYLDLISLPLDGSTEEKNAKTKEKGHFSAIMRDLDWLKKYPEIDVKLCTPVTRYNLDDVPDIVKLADEYAKSTQAGVFYNIFQAYPRAMHSVDWQDLLVTDAEFQRLRRRIPATARIRVNFLDHETLDKLYMMIFPDGSLIIPRGKEFINFGPFLETEDFDVALSNSEFDSSKH
nr:radical SAM protein [Fodinibius sp.]NIV09772.1 radical SAM protein [Fodinibius sp.]NIY23293.1 radical SAM protein [Fodinibius sp.]